MIIAAYGIPGLTCVEIALIFNTLKINYGLVRKQRLLKVLDNNKDFQPIFPVVFNSGSMFLRTKDKFKPTTRVVAFIVDNPIVLTRSLHLPLIGAEPNKHAIEFTKITEQEIRSILLGCTHLDIPLEIESKIYKPVDEIFKKYEHSDLSKIQTFLYKIKDLDSRDKVSKLTKNWLLTSAPYSNIEGKLHKELSPSVANTLKSLMTQPSVNNLRVAIRKVKSKKLTPSKASKIYKVSSFDLRFLLANRTKSD